MKKCELCGEKGIFVGGVNCNHPNPKAELFPRPPTAEEWRLFQWYMFKGKKALQALEDGNVERATEILRMKL